MPDIAPMPSTDCEPFLTPANATAAAKLAMEKKPFRGTCQV
jgi:hypothetical protein